MKRRKKGPNPDHPGFDNFEERASYWDEDKMDEDYMWRDSDENRSRDKSRKNRPADDDEDEDLQ